MATPKLGSGGRFKQLSQKLQSYMPGVTAKGRAMAASRPGSSGKVNNPNALAAWIGRKKYGAKKMASMSAKGRKKA